MRGAEEYEERFRRLTAREARVLVLLLEGQVSTRDIADVLGSTPAAVQTIRQSIRRKLAVPRNGNLGAFVNGLPGLRDLARRPPHSTSPTPVPERRQNLVLRAAMREVDTAAVRVRAKAAALASLAGDASDEEHEAMLAEAAMVGLIAQELDEVRTRSLNRARGNSG